MTLANEAAPSENEILLQEIRSELEQSQQSLKDITLTIEQSQVEQSKLTQRNATVTGHLQQVQAQLETLPRTEIRAAYVAALEAQQRLLVMRGQLEKLQNEQTVHKRYISILQKAKDFLEESVRLSKDKASSGSAMLAMVINAQEAERQRLSKQMHDGPAQALSNFIVQTEIASRYFELDPARAKEELNSMKNAATSTFQNIRAFIFELRPMMLDDLGLIPTVRRYVDTFKEQTGLDVELGIKGKEKRLESYVEVMIFRAVQELMGNAARHNLDSPGKIQINLQIAMDETLVRVTVSDNGKGFDPATLKESPGLGLKLIRDRVEMLGGYLDIDAAVGQGARISFQVPNLEPVFLLTQS